MLVFLSRSSPMSYLNRLLLKLTTSRRPTSAEQHKPDQSEDRGDDNWDTPTPMIKQPQTRAITCQQLTAEVKGIYAGLCIVESKCIEVDSTRNSENPQTAVKLNNEQWQALIALHRTLLHEHYDFFLASQHPLANSKRHQLPSKYAMPARMWRHGIRSLLEILRHRLPDTLDHMKTFLNIAYGIMALLFETVPAFEVRKFRLDIITILIFKCLILIFKYRVHGLNA